MNKAELINEFAARNELTKGKAKECLANLQAIVFENMKDGMKYGASGGVKLFDGVTLTAVYQPERVRRNPQTGEDMLCPARNAPKAKFGKAIKDYLNS